MKERDKCVRCGKCCEIKIGGNGSRFLQGTGNYCSFFKKGEDGLGICTVYKERPKHQLGSHGLVYKCMPARTAAIAGLLPPECPYAKEIPDYKSRVIDYYG